MQDMSELIPITVFIADRSYRLRIHPKDEEVLRKTIKTINEKIVEFRSQFAGKDMQDYVAMVLMWYATEQHAPVKQQLENDHVSDQLDGLERLLEKQLKAEEKIG
jgi:cell division protein ZapA